MGPVAHDSDLVVNLQYCIDDCRHDCHIELAQCVTKALVDYKGGSVTTRIPLDRTDVADSHRVLPKKSIGLRYALHEIDYRTHLKLSNTSYQDQRLV